MSSLGRNWSKRGRVAVRASGRRSACTLAWSVVAYGLARLVQDIARELVVHGLVVLGLVVLEVLDC